VDSDGVPHRLTVHRCALLRPVSATLSADALAVYHTACTPDSNATKPPYGDQ
jgi:hypothetical protein